MSPKWRPCESTSRPRPAKAWTRRRRNITCANGSRPSARVGRRAPTPTRNWKTSPKPLKRAGLPADVPKKPTKAASPQMHGDSAEASVVRTYLDWLGGIAVEKDVQGSRISSRPKTCWTRDHCGLTKIGTASLNTSASASSIPTPRGPSSAFAGPSRRGQDLARPLHRKGALGRKFQRISLGGMRDEAEIPRARAHVHRSHAGPHHSGDEAGRDPQRSSSSMKSTSSVTTSGAILLRLSWKRWIRNRTSTSAIII